MSLDQILTSPSVPCGTWLAGHFNTMVVDGSSSSGSATYGSLTVTGALSAGSAAVTGAVTAGSAAVTGAMSAGSGNITGNFNVNGSLTASSALSPIPVSVPGTGGTFAVTALMSGKTILIPAQSSALQLNLPAAAVGLNYKFLQTAGTPGFASTIAAPVAGTLRGVATLGPSTLTQIHSSGNQFIAFSATSIVGDWIDIWCDGTNWYYRGDTYGAAGITIA